MTQFGALGAVVSEVNTVDTASAVATVRELEELGFSTVWMAGGQGNNLPRIAEVVQGTEKIRVASGILSVDVVPAAEVVAAFDELGERFVVGLGGAHGARPLATMNAYLDAISAVPQSSRILSALGPRMLELARTRAAGAYPYLVTPGYVASARAALGTAHLAVLLDIVPEEDAAAARAVVRGGSLGFLTKVPGYAANLRRMGFTDADLADLSDRLVDGVTTWGSFDAIVARLREYREAGADELVLQLDRLPRSWWPRLAEALR